MNDAASKQSPTLSRRVFCKSTLAAAGLCFMGVSAPSAQAKTKVRFYKNLGNGHIGVRANQKQALEYAVRFGFEGIAPSPGEFMGKSDAEIADWVATMKQKSIKYGSAGLSVDFRTSDEKFKQGMANLPKEAAVMQKMGVTRVATWILPGSSRLTYLQNFKQHESRLREAAKVFKDHGIRLGLEFVGPRTSRVRNRFPFICTQAGMMELVRAIGTGNVGLLMDSWHWYTSHGTVEELQQLSGSDIVHVHVNDAPAGIDVDKQIDNKRKLPVTTGVIDLKGFINSLAKIGYDGAVECEPFDQQLNGLKDDDKLQRTIDALNRLWDLIV